VARPVRALARRSRTEADWLRSRGANADLAVFHEFAAPPYGGGNQFLLALVRELEGRGLEVEVNRLSGGTRACLYNSFNFDFGRLKRFARDGVRMVHRVDGPIGAYRGFDDGTDRRIVGINQELADATILQSAYSLAKHRELGLELRDPVVIHNAVGGAFGSFLEIDPTVLNRNFQVNTMALLYLARRLAPAMIEAGEGAILVTGNTSALRGKPRFAGFAPTKAAQRILAEAMARELGPKGVHVAYLVIDAVIDLEWTRRMFSGAPNEFFIRPAAIAEEAWHVAHQDRCAWSFHVEVRPFGETW
jgi:NAD(P)-dependent dehydrogenase (short-subunit alcohol dehydrogenase family)